MRFGSVCSGIEAASVAWKPLGWTCAFVSEIDRFARAVLSHRLPDVPLHGDFTTIRGDEYGTVDLLVGGTPCQSFSVAGLRGGMADDRGNLALEYLRLVDRLRPRWVVWENVPGVLSSNKGRDFGAFLGALGELGYGWAYRVLDAQHFGVAQRRRRVFVVGHARGSWQRTAAVLFERESLRRDSPKGGAEGAEVAAITASGVGTCGADDNQAQAGHLIPFDTTNITSRTNRSNPKPGRECHTLSANAHPPAIAFNARQDPDVSGSVTHPLDTDGHSVGIHLPHGVRRLTPRECERLQGFPDDWTLVPYTHGKPAKPTPRYRAIGNSMAVPVVRWIGERIQAVEGIA